MVDQLTALDPHVVEQNLSRIRAEITASGRDPDTVEILSAIKYLPPELLGALAEGGVTVVGENRAQALVEKQAAVGPAMFTAWDFIGQLQSRKVKELLGTVRYIHSLASDTALEQLSKHEANGTEVLIEVNVARDADKSGIAPKELAGFIHRCPITVAGLMTMPPHAADPEQSRPHFRLLTELAAEHGLRHVSMGTTQDYRVAVEEGATIIRLGTALFTAS
jgi:pyridoxal phosphate enzyme (YggS family)